MAYKKRVTHNLAESEHVFISGDIELRFSSEFNLKRFLLKFKENRTDMKYRLTSDYNVIFDLPDFFDVVLYFQIEKRGTYVVLNGKEVVTCRDLIRLAGQMQTLNALNALSGTTTGD